MRRALTYALIGGGLGIAFLAVFGAIYGCLYGAGANSQHPPGFQGAVLGAMTWAVFLWPVAGVIGALAGFGAGLAGAAADALSGRFKRPRRAEGAGE